MPVRRITKLNLTIFYLPNPLVPFPTGLLTPTIIIKEPQ